LDDVEAVQDDVLCLTYSLPYLRGKPELLSQAEVSKFRNPFAPTVSMLRCPSLQDKDYDCCSVVAEKAWPPTSLKHFAGCQGRFVAEVKTQDSTRV
jgi:hypothetical protein